MNPFKGTVPTAFIIVIIIAVLSGVYFVWDRYSNSLNDTVDSYKECVAAGNPVMESFPEQCIDATTGKHFVNK